MKTTTLAKIQRCWPNNRMWGKLLTGLGKNKADEKPIPYPKILEICGLFDAILATESEKDYRWVQELALTYARRVSVIDPSAVPALVVAERFFQGEASQEEANELASKEWCPAMSALIFAKTANSEYAPDSSTVAFYAAQAAESAAMVAGQAVVNTKGTYAAAKAAEAAEREWQEAEFRRVVS